MVADASAEIVIDGWLHNFGWIVLPIKIGPLIRVDFVLDTSFPLTRISQGTLDVLQAFGLITPISLKNWRIRGLHVEVHTLPDVEVRVSRVVSRLGLEAMLGLSFLANFEEVCFHRPSARLNLRR